LFVKIYIWLHVSTSLSGAKIFEKYI